MNTQRSATRITNILHSNQTMIWEKQPFLVISLECKQFPLFSCILQRDREAKTESSRSEHYVARYNCTYVGNATITHKKTVRNNSYIAVCIWNRMLDVNRTSAYEVAPTAATEMSHKTITNCYEVPTKLSLMSSPLEAKIHLNYI